MSCKGREYVRREHEQYPLQDPLNRVVAAEHEQDEHRSRKRNDEPTVIHVENQSQGGRTTAEIGGNSEKVYGEHRDQQHKAPAATVLFRDIALESTFCDGTDPRTDD